MRLKKYFYIFLFMVMLSFTSILLSCLKSPHDISSSIKNSKINAKITFEVDNKNYTWNTKDGTFKYALLITISNLSESILNISEFDIAVLNDNGEELFSQVVTDKSLLEKLFTSIEILPNKKLSTTLYYTLPYRILKKQFMTIIVLQNENITKSFALKYDYIDNYFPYASISAGPIKFYPEGFLDWKKDSQIIEIYTYLFESYLLSSLEYVKIIGPGNEKNFWNLKFLKYNKDKYYFIFHNKITKDGNFLNGDYLFETKFKEGTIIKASQYISYGNSNKMKFPPFPEVKYFSSENIVNISNFPFKNNEIQIYKSTEKGYDFIGYYSIDKVGKYEIDKIFKNLTYVKGKSENDIFGTILLNLCSYTHTDEETKNIKNDEWVNVLYIYSKSIILPKNN